MKTRAKDPKFWKNKTKADYPPIKLTVFILKLLLFPFLLFNTFP